MMFKQFKEYYRGKYQTATGLTFFPVHGRDTKLFNIFSKDYVEDKDLFKAVDDFFQVWSDRLDEWISQQDPDILFFYSKRSKVQFLLNKNNLDREIF